MPLRTYVARCVAIIANRMDVVSNPSQLAVSIRTPRARYRGGTRYVGSPAARTLIPGSPSTAGAMGSGSSRPTVRQPPLALASGTCTSAASRESLRSVPCAELNAYS